MLEKMHINRNHCIVILVILILIIMLKYDSGK